MQLLIIQRFYQGTETKTVYCVHRERACNSVADEQLIDTEHNRPLVDLYSRLL